MAIGSYDGDDVNIKVDDGSDDGVKVTGTTDGSKIRVDGSNKLLGHDGVHHADVFLDQGVRKLQTTATAIVESLLGEAVFPFTTIKILTVGVNTNTIRTQITDDSVDITTTKTASETTVHELAKKHRDELNADSNFDALYTAFTPRDSNQVCIQAKLIQTLRPDSGDVVVTPTGSITIELFSDKIIDHPLALALFPTKEDCTKGTVAVQGIVGVVESGRPPRRLMIETAANSSDMAINASGGDVVFKLTNNVDYDGTKDFIVTELRIESTANSFSVGAGKYIRVAELTNGHMVQIRSEDELDYDENLKLLEDIHHAFVIGEGSKFDLINSAGDGSLVAVFARPFFIRKAGTFATPDDITVTIRDNLSLITRLQMSAVGFFED